MERIGVRELRQHASRWLRRVAAGESFEITERGPRRPLLPSSAPLFTPSPGSRACPRSSPTCVPMSGDVWYLDTSAFVKLIQAESESDALQTWLFERLYASSDLLRTEAIRVARRAGTDVLARCRHALGALALVRIDAAVFESAAE